MRTPEEIAMGHCGYERQSLIEEIRARDAEVAAQALRDAADALPSLTEGEGREGTRTWRQTVRDAYSIAVEESQSALRARADRIEAGESDAHA